MANVLYSHFSYIAFKLYISTIMSFSIYANGVIYSVEQKIRMFGFFFLGIILKFHWNGGIYCISASLFMLYIYFYDIKLTSVIFIELIILRADLTRLFMLETTRYLCRKVELCRLLRQWKLHIVCFWS